MNRLAVRFADKNSASIDMHEEEWQPALHALLTILDNNKLPGQNGREHVTKVEKVIYDPEYKDMFRYERVEVPDVITFVYTPPPLEEAQSHDELQQAPAGSETTSQQALEGAIPRRRRRKASQDRPKTQDGEDPSVLRVEDDAGPKDLQEPAKGPQTRARETVRRSRQTK